MEAEFEQSPTQTLSLPIVKVSQSMKKRKLQAEHLGLPLPKHKCSEVKNPYDEPVSMFHKNPDRVQTHANKAKIEDETLNGGSELGSGKGSNSFAGDFADSAMSVYYEAAELNPAYATTFTYDRPSTSSVNCNDNNFENFNTYSDSIAVMETNYRTEELKFVNEVLHHPPTETLEEQLQEFEGEASYICSEYGDHFIEECTDKEVEEIIYANSMNPNTYVLSSGRWSVNQEAQSVSRKPTIDQEFEQYFSTLML